MKVPLWPVRTGQKHAPWIWIGVLAGPWAAKLFFEQISNVAVTFKLREFVSEPYVITLVGSLNLIFNIFVGASCSYASDRIQTRWGRRKPFLLIGWGTIAVGCWILPQIHTLSLLVVALFCYELLRDSDTPYESLINEVVPPHQRGRCQAALIFVRQVMLAFFFAVLIGRWDNTYTIAGIGMFRGDQLLFWTGSVLAVASMALVGFGIKEAARPGLGLRLPALRFGLIVGTLQRFAREVFGQRQWLTLYGIGLAQTIFWLGFGNLTPLLFTEQWGFSKQTYGNVIAISTPAVLCLFLPLGGWLADRVDRLLMFRLLAISITCVHLAFFLYLKLRTGASPPPLAIVISYWIAQTGIGSIGAVCTISMVFDFVPRDRLGTVCSGMGITRGLSNVLINNGIGLWITGATWLNARGIRNDTIAYDYESGFLYLSLLGLMATGVAFWFARQVRNGRIRKLGVIEARQTEEDLVT